MAKFSRIERNVHQITYDYSMQQNYKFLLMSDIHWDNPHCKRDVLKRHLEYAAENDVPVIVNGDFFCAMQGKYDGRRSKSNIRDEHNNSRYLDSLVETAVEWFAPYKNVLQLIGYGNHETSILRHCETDLLQRFAALYNAQANGNVQIGGYGGWLLLRFERGKDIQTYRIKYFHGAGGGGIVTKGTIQAQRGMAMIHGADMQWQGHIHEMWTMTHMAERLNKQNHVELVKVLHVRTPTYKEEYEDGYLDFHVERGRPPKPIGCYELGIQVRRKDCGGLLPDLRAMY